MKTAGTPRVVPALLGRSILRNKYVREQAENIRMAEQAGRMRATSCSAPCRVTRHTRAANGQRYRAGVVKTPSLPSTLANVTHVSRRQRQRTRVRHTCRRSRQRHAAFRRHNATRNQRYMQSASAAPRNTCHNERCRQKQRTITRRAASRKRRRRYDARCARRSNGCRRVAAYATRARRVDPVSRSPVTCSPPRHSPSGRRLGLNTLLQW